VIDVPFRRGQPGHVTIGPVPECPHGSDRGSSLADQARAATLPLRPLTTGELLDAAVVLLRARPVRLVWLGIALAVAEQLVLFPLRRLSDQDLSLLPATGRLTQFGLLVMAGFATEAACIALLGGVAAREGPRALLGPAAPVRPPARLGAVAVVAILAAAVVSLGAWAFPVLLSPLQSAGIPLAVILTIVCWPIPYGLVGLAAPAVVLDQRGPVRALGRSIRLASRDALRAVWIRVLGYLGWVLIRYALVGATIALVELFFTSPSSTVDAILLAGAAILVNALAYPMLGCLDVALHLESRMRSEGLDIQLRGALRRGVSAQVALAAPGRRGAA
jgi:hypothetical protein